MHAADLFEVPGKDKYDIEEEVGHGTFSEVSWAARTGPADVRVLQPAHLLAPQLLVDVDLP